METPETKRPGSVLFVCGMNAIRSPMAAQITRKLFGNEIFVSSAGVHAGEPDGFMQQVMNEYGVDAADHDPRTLEELEDDYFDLIVTLSPEAHHRSLEWASDQAAIVEYWPTMDPSTVAGSRSQVVEAYRDVRNDLENKLKKRLAK